jgi:hypothetical protein
MAEAHHDATRLCAPMASKVLFAREPGATFVREVRQRKHTGAPQPATLQELALALANHLTNGGGIQTLPARAKALGSSLNAELRATLDEAVALGVSEADALLLLAHWALARDISLARSSSATTLRAHVDGIPVDLVAQCVMLFDRRLGTLSVDSPVSPRMRRLHAAMTRPSK